MSPLPTTQSVAELTLDGALGMSCLRGCLVLDEVNLGLVVDGTLCDHLGANIESVRLLGQHIDGSLVLDWGNVGNDLGLAGGRCGCIDEDNAIVLPWLANIHITDDLLFIVILGRGVQIEVLADNWCLEVGQMADVFLLFLIVDSGSWVNASQTNMIVDNTGVGAAAR